MTQMIEANWLALALVLIIGLLVAWWIYARATRPRERHRAPDALDEGVAPAARNQALIDAPSSAALGAAALADSGPSIFGGVGEVIAVAAQDEVAAASAADLPRETIVATAGEADDLRKIKGVGPKLVTLLASLGITRFSQIAAWTDADIDRIDAQLGTFAGRVRRDAWVEQAKFLAAGDVAGFEGKFGKI
jgi:predicted flap endonuclease-1-like 5' DNA nuclease